MSDKRNYPTRMHEVLGVEPFEKFQVVGGYEGRNYSLDKDGWMRWGDSNWESDVEDVYNAINNGIIHLPTPLTDEQILALNAAVKWFGFKWLVKDKCESVCFWQNKPEKRENHWSAYGGGMYADIMTVKVDNLVSWSDPAPLDIVQVLRQNGVEVEG